VTVIEPGMVATELRQHITDPEVRKAQEDAVRSGTPLQGEDVAAVIVFAVTRPEHVSISEILVRPTEQVCRSCSNLTVISHACPTCSMCYK